MTTAAPPLAFFDFDGTLTTRDSLMPFLRFIAGTPRYCLQMVRLSPVLSAYMAGLIPNHHAKQRVLEHCLGGLSLALLEKQGDLFARTAIPDMLRHEGMKRLQWHKAQGHHCVLVSASLELYLQPWAHEQGFTECIATSLQTEMGTTLGRFNGRNCYGNEKLARIKARFPDLAQRETFAYGDSKGDFAMLNACKYAFIQKRGVFKTYPAM